LPGTIIPVVISDALHEQNERAGAFADCLQAQEAAQDAAVGDADFVSMA
jgi:hypothetical protein